MGLFSAFYASLSGLSTNSSNLNVIGNNLANLNTIGFKGSSSTFQDLFGASLGASSTSGNGNPIAIGLGARLGAVAQNFGQGSFQSTSSATDMAIEGNGFFAVNLLSGGRGYTRAGNFSVDKSGFLVDPNGARVQGWNRNAAGAIIASGLPSDVFISTGTTQTAKATSNFNLATNLDATAPNGTTFASPVTVFDSLGATHTLTITYTKTGPGAWTAALTTDDPGPGGVPTPNTVNLTFNSSGTLTAPAADVLLNISAWSNGALAQAINWDIFPGSSTTASLTQLAAPSNTSAAVQDGYGAGTLKDLLVDQNGIVVGNFTNGQAVPLAQVAIAIFNNIQGLSKTGQNYWTETLSSGPANIGLANQGGRGSILGANLELSNVDVAEEFTKLIVSQRGYQANSRVVTTADDLLQETLNLKR